MSDFLTPAELAEQWRCTYRFVVTEIKRKNLPATKIGARWLITREDAAAYWEAHRSVPSTGPRIRRPKARAS